MLQLETGVFAMLLQLKDSCLHYKLYLNPAYCLKNILDLHHEAKYRICEKR